MKQLSINRTISWFCLLVLVTGCASPFINTPQPTSTVSTAPATLSSTDAAQSILIQFFDLLNTKQYAAADTLYGGDYEQLKVFSADVDPADHARLWANACELAGLQCLKIRSVALKSQIENTFSFQVEFSNPAGDLFVLGPCCGSNETEMPPVSQFEYKVNKTTDGKFVVMDLPPYVP